MTAASTTTWRSAEDIIQAICEFILNGEDLTIEMTLDRSILLLALCFKGGIQGSDSPFKGEYLKLPCGYPGQCPTYFCIRRYRVSNHIGLGLGIGLGIGIGCSVRDDLSIRKRGWFRVDSIGTGRRKRVSFRVNSRSVPS